MGNGGTSGEGGICVISLRGDGRPWSAVSFLGGVCGKASVDRRFGAYWSQKEQFWWQQFLVPCEEFFSRGSCHLATIPLWKSAHASTYRLCECNYSPDQRLAISRLSLPYHVKNSLCSEKNINTSNRQLLSQTDQSCNSFQGRLHV